MYTMIGEVEILATSKGEAFNIADDDTSPITLKDVKDADYLDGSWEADKGSEVVEVEEE